MIVNTAAELAQYIKNSKKYENYYMGQCVLHDDKHPSFKFWDGDDGRPAGYCLACGGKIRATFDKLGLEYPSAKGKYTPKQSSTAIITNLAATSERKLSLISQMEARKSTGKLRARTGRSFTSSQKANCCCSTCRIWQTRRRERRSMWQRAKKTRLLLATTECLQ